jgi:hypothetical protein
MRNNTFSWQKTEGKALQKVQLTLSDKIHDLIMEPLKEAYLLPILQGETRRVEDNMTYYCFELPMEDAEKLKQAFLQVYTQHTGLNTEN